VNEQKNPQEDDLTPAEDADQDSKSRSVSRGPLNRNTQGNIDLVDQSSFLVPEIKNQKNINSNLSYNSPNHGLDA
jgi:hypothetical protein